MTSDRGTVFWLCRAAAVVSDMRKYPPLPVLACAAWKPVDRSQRLEEKDTEPQ